jgi:hypothetical protein
MGSHLIIAVNKNLPLIGITQHCCHGYLPYYSQKKGFDCFNGKLLCLAKHTALRSKSSKLG